MARSNIVLSIYDSSTNTEICFIAGVYYDIFCSIAGDNNDNPIPQVKNPVPPNLKMNQQKENKDIKSFGNLLFTEESSLYEDKEHANTT